MILRHVAARLVVLLCLALVLGACGASARTRALRVNLVAVNVARDTMLAVSREREEQIFDGCNPPSCTKEEARAQLDAWRGKVDVVAKAIDVAYRSVHDAALLDDAKSESDARAAATKVLALIKELKELKQ